MEGVVSYDVYGFLKIMVQKRGWFSIDRLNHCISKFKFPSKDRPNSIVLANRHKLSGSAAQMWNLIRYLPYILYDLVPDLSDPVFDLLVRLHDVVDLCTAPILQASEIEHMDFKYKPDNTLCNPSIKSYQFWKGFLLRVKSRRCQDNSVIQSVRLCAFECCK